jgi:F-type H+-transporting ATPase subunit gamma
MAGLKEIRRRLKSVHNTKKITYAMKLVSAAKLRKTQDAVVRSRGYTDALRDVLAQLQAGGDYTHPLFEARPLIKSVCVLVIGGGRGLCGAFNTNTNRAADGLLKELSEKHPGAAISWVLVGRKPAEAFRRIERRYEEAFEVLPDDPAAWPINDICQKLEIGFLKHDYDQVYVVYTRFRSALSLVPTVEQLLPMSREALVEQGAGIGAADRPDLVLFEPNPQRVFNAVVPRILRATVRQAAFDTKASEHASRMTAMDSATKNAADLIDALTLKRNKLRQTGITNQLLDIVGGAEALK